MDGRKKKVECFNVCEYVKICRLTINVIFRSRSISIRENVFLVVGSHEAHCEP